MKQIVTKENFINAILKEQEKKKAQGVKLKKVRKSTFDNFLANAILKYGVNNTQEVTNESITISTPVSTGVNNKLSKEDFVTKVVNNQNKKKAKGQTTTKVSNYMLNEMLVELGADKNELVSISKETNIIKEIVEDVKSVVKPVIEEVYFKTKDVARKDGLMQIAFDF